MLPKAFRFLAGCGYARAAFPFLTDNVAQTENKNCAQHVVESGKATSGLCPPGLQVPYTRPPRGAKGKVQSLH